MDLKAANVIRTDLPNNILANVHGILTVQELWENLNIVSGIRQYLKLVVPEEAVLHAMKGGRYENYII